MAKQIVVDGVLTTYLEHNAKAKEIVIVLHGWGHTAEMWLPVVERLPDTRRYILVDLPGFGGSGFLPGVPDVPDYARWVENLLKKLEIKEVSLLGHSFGGQIAAYMATHYPKLIRELMLVSPSVIRTKSMKDKIKIFIFKQFGWLKSFIPKAWVEAVLKNVSAVDYYNSSQDHREILKKVVTFEQAETLHRIRCRTLLLWGDKDTAIAYKALEVADSIPYCELKVLWGVGHNAHLYKPNMIAREVEAFYRR